jgi:hypothetical protein
MRWLADGISYKTGRVWGLHRPGAWEAMELIAKRQMSSLLLKWVARAGRFQVDY